MSIIATAVRTVPCAAFLFLAAPALAQGTAEQRSACSSDVMRLCATDIPDPGRITACLRRQQAQVSAPCQTVMRAPSDPIEVASTGTLRRRAAP